jgi:uncharacterized protein YtpQ (UPF0354 family)
MMESDGIDEPDESSMGPWEFTEELAELLEQALDVGTIGRRHLALHLRWNGRPIVIELENFYAHYRRDAAHLPTIAQALIESVRSHGTGETPVRFEDVKARIFPMLKPAALLAEVHERGIPMLAYRLFLADLAIFYVIDERQSVAYINEEHLRSWGVQEPILYQIALENLLQASVKPGTCTVVGEGERRLMIYSTGDGYDAARLLLTELLAEWQEHLPGQLVIGIPQRDFLIGFSDADSGIFRQVAHQVARDSTHSQYSLTDQLFTLINGRIELYEYDVTSSDQL